MQNAVSIWSNVTPLIFQQVKSQDADIKISFWDLGKKQHKRDGVVSHVKGKWFQSINKNIVHLV